MPVPGTDQNRPAHGHLLLKCNNCVIARSQNYGRRELRKNHICCAERPGLTLIHLAEMRRDFARKLTRLRPDVSSSCRTLFELQRPRRGQAQQAMARLQPRNAAGAAREIGTVCIAELDPEPLCIAQSVAPPRRKALQELLEGYAEPTVPYRRLCRQALHDVGG